MREPKTKTIGETTYTVNQLGPTRGLDLLHDIVKVAGPAFAPIAANVGELAKLLDSDTEGMRFDFLSEAVRGLVSGIDKTITREALKTLASVTIVEGKGPLASVYELHFAQVGLAELFKWAAFALQTQYDDFLGVFASAMQSGTRRAEKTEPK